MTTFIQHGATMFPSKQGELALLSFPLAAHSQYLSCGSTSARASFDLAKIG